MQTIRFLLFIALISLSTQVSVSAPFWQKGKGTDTGNVKGETPQSVDPGDVTDFHHQSGCEKTLLNLADYDKVLRSRQGVCQEGGTCYLEAAISAFEDIIQLKLGFPSSISRVKAFADILIDRAQKTMAPEDIGHPQVENKKGHLKPLGENGLDLVSGGLVKNAIRLIERSDLLVILPKNRADVEKENFLIKMLYNRAGFLMKEYKDAIAQVDPHSEEITAIMIDYFQQLSDLKTEIVGLAIENENRKREEWNESKGRGVYSLINESDFVSIDVSKDSIVVYPHSLEETSHDITQLNIYRKKEAEERVQEKGLYVGYHSWGTIFQRIISHIDRGIGVSLSYHYMDEYYDKETLNWEIPKGVYPEAPVKGKSGHAVSIVGYKLDEDQNIEYLLLRDSNGVRYRHMHVDFLKNYAKEFIFFDTQEIRNKDDVNQTLILHESELRPPKGG